MRNSKPERGHPGRSGDIGAMVLGFSCVFTSAEPQPKERGCVRRGPAAAASKPRRHPLESIASIAVNLRRLMLRAHSPAPGEILATREEIGARHLRRFSVGGTDRGEPAATFER